MVPTDRLLICDSVSEFPVLGKASSTGSGCRHFQPVLPPGYIELATEMLRFALYFPNRTSQRVLSMPLELSLRHLLGRSSAGWAIAFLSFVFVKGMSDESKALAQGYSPDEAAGKMTAALGFEVKLVAAEPLVRQPVSVEFDDRGRMWVMQYLQYPNPEGLKRVKVDRYSRTVYDRVPEPPPRGPRGADKLTILEDTDGDGRMDKAKDFVDGLNLATGMALGYGGVFVLNVPYLLFYPDRNHDDVPDRDPIVLLTGFGMEDTSSLANSLIFGPDGWLYGTQGTNITANIRGIEFEQGIWRYHPITRDFELFCEGGGNPWGLDFDRQGNLFFSTNNGGFVMHHGMQGAYYAKSFQKHGELHNPYAFGWFDHVPHKNFKGGHVTVGGCVYQDDVFPEAFRGRYIAADLLGHAVNRHEIIPTGSTFQTEQGDALLQANDTWFAPSDLTIGPDGCVYVADWHDKRTGHPDPDADWDKTNGRVFRIQPAGYQPREHVDPNLLSLETLIGRLSHPSAWHVRRALRVLVERNDPHAVPELHKLATTTVDDRVALHALWGLYACAGFDETVSRDFLSHRSPAVRAWTVRFLGDSQRIDVDTRDLLVELATKESDPAVLAQLACSARRLSAADAFPIVTTVLGRQEAAADPYVPLLCWWAVEQFAATEPDLALEFFANDEAWKNPTIRDVILGRLMRRFAADGTQFGFRACTRLYQSTSSPDERRRLLVELNAGLALIGAQTRKEKGLPLGASYNRFAVKQADKPAAAQRLRSVPVDLEPILIDIWDVTTSDPETLRAAMRMGSADAYARVVALADDPAGSSELRREMFQILGEMGDGSCVLAALRPIERQESEGMQSSAMNVLARFSDDRIPETLLSVYDKMNEMLKAQARGVLFGRKEWAALFLQGVETGRFKAADVQVEELRRIALHNNPELDAIVRKHWGNVRAGTPEEKLAEIRRLSNDLRAAPGKPEAGKELFKKHCATCHTLFGEGNKIGPELTQANRKDQEYLLVSIVDPASQIRKEFMSYVVMTKDGRLTTGLLAEETPTAITLLGAKNERTTIQRGDIDEMVESPTSLMPEKLLEPLKPEEIRDLFSYLQK